MKDIQRIIEADIKTWALRMAEKYDWLTIRYEYSDKHECFMISFYGENLDNEEFCKTALEFEDETTEKYGDEEPLFCDNEDMFELSENAVCVGKEWKKGVRK